MKSLLIFLLLFYHEWKVDLIATTGLPTKDYKDDPKIWRFKAWFVVSAFIKVCWMVKHRNTLQGTLNARKQDKQISYNRLWSLILCGFANIFYHVFKPNTLESTAYSSLVELTKYIFWILFWISYFFLWIFVNYKVV